MCIRNIDVAHGLINGTMLELLAIGRRYLQVRIVSGSQTGRTELLTTCMFNITSEASGLPFTITRKQVRTFTRSHVHKLARSHVHTFTQYPIILAYCLSVHKAQGQSLDFVGLIFETDPFAHGQLYVALSRVANWMRIRMYMRPGVQCIHNLVYEHLIK
jgi:hypothetical protein